MSANDFKLPFSVESLMEEARKRTNGRDDLGDGPFMEPLSLFVESLENEAMLNPIGKWIAQERCLGHIVNRLNYVNDRKRFPDIAKQKIVKPVFIIGFPRTGTTILHDAGSAQSRALDLGGDVSVAAAADRDLPDRSAHRHVRRSFAENG